MTTTEKLTGAKRDKAFKAWLKALPIEYLLCRSGRLHSFPPEGYAVAVEGRYYVQVEICAVCHTKRKQRIVKTSGYLDGASYEREDKRYDVPVGIGRLTRVEYGMFRIERIERFLAAQRAAAKAARGK